MAKKRFTTEEFIDKSNIVHKHKYDYSKTNYTKSSEKVCVICPEHGEFWVTGNHHMRGIGCPKCSGKNKTTEEWVKEAREIHGSKYDYSKVEYINATTKVCIVCPKHGEFWQRPSDHLTGYGCPHCRSIRMNNSDFISKAKLVHSDKYDYSNVEYKGCRIPVKILCHKHGEFEQTPFKHLQGHGCPHCNESHLERNVRSLLEANNIMFQYQCGKKTFDWLGSQTLDFYIPKYNIAIECQGEQHFEPVDFANKGKEWAEKCFIDNFKRDKNKYEKCFNNSVDILYVNKKDYKTVIGKWLKKCCLE